MHHLLHRTPLRQNLALRAASLNPLPVQAVPRMHAPRLVTVDAAECAQSRREMRQTMFYAALPVACTGRIELH